MQREVANSFASGKPKGFDTDDGTTIISPSEEPDAHRITRTPELCLLTMPHSVSDDLKEPAKITKAICTRNTVGKKKVAAFKLTLPSRMTLQADLARNRYTQLLNGKTLAKSHTILLEKMEM